MGCGFRRFAFLCAPYFPRKTKTIALCQIDIKILVTVGTLFQFDRDSGGLVLFLSSGHVFGTGDVLVVCNTAVLVHLQEKVVVDCLYLIFLADIATEQTCIEVRGGLVLVITASVQIVDVKAKCQLLVDVDGEVGLEAFFTVHFAAGFVVGKIGVRHVAVGEKHLVGTCEKTGEGSHEDGRFAFLPFEEQT